ncbi:MAG: CdaR family protein [Candidatus Limnocylindria bacterium]
MRGPTLPRVTLPSRDDLARLARTMRPGRARLRRLAVNDLPLKAAALAVAVLMWVASAEAAAPQVTQAFDGRVPIERPEVPDGHVLVGQLGDVAVTIRGPQPIVQRIGQQDLVATIDLADVDSGRASPQEAPVTVVSLDDRVRVVSVTPATIPVQLERITTRTLAVQARFANDPPPGSAPGVATFTPQEVIVRGAESLVGSVAAVLAVVRFGDTPTDVSQSVQAMPVDAEGQRVEGVQVDPTGVQVRVPVLPTATTRTVPVLWRLAGTVAPGYWISRVATDPAAVTVRGEQQALGGLEAIETLPIDVSNLTADRTFVVGLAPPDGVTLIEPRDATVTVSVIALSGTRPFPLVAVGASGLGPGLTVQIAPSTVAVTLAGLVPRLSEIGAQQVSASVDVSGLGPGTYERDVSVALPLGTTLAGVQPGRVTVTIGASE